MEEVIIGKEIDYEEAINDVVGALNKHRLPPLAALGLLDFVHYLLLARADAIYSDKGTEQGYKRMVRRIKEDARSKTVGEEMDAEYTRDMKERED